MTVKKYFYILLLALTFTGPFAHAQTSSADLAVTPAVIDEKGQQRDILKENITVKNNTSHVLQLYPSVNDIKQEEGNIGFGGVSGSEGLATSLANWIELSRGMVQLGPGEEKTIPFIIHVNQNAVANTYHAQIVLTEGETRQQADSKPPLGTVAVNLEVKADIKELLQLKKFSTDNLYFSGDNILFNYQLQNIGNQDLSPRGHISIYNRNGAEVATIDVNKDSKTVSPDQIAQMASSWTAANGFGRYKALLTVDYGSSQTASVTDTVFFWVVPWKQMLIMFTVSLITVIVLALYFHNWLERRHLFKFAHAGLLNEDTLKKIQPMEEFQNSMPPVQQSVIAAPLPVVTPPPVQNVEHYEPKPAKKSRFALFKRKPKTVPAQSEYTQTALEARKEERAWAEHRKLKEVLAKEENPVNGNSIDLKQLRARAQSTQNYAYPAPQQTAARKVEVNGHVISLKKK